MAKKVKSPKPEEVKQRKSLYIPINSTPVFGEHLLHKEEKNLSSRIGSIEERLNPGIIEPPENPETLIKLPKRNSVLLQCIACMVSNIESPGHRFELKTHLDVEVANDQEAQVELNALEEFSDAPNPFDTLTVIREKTRQDLETLGYAFIEVVRDIGRKVKAIYHVPAHKYKLTKVDDTPQTISYISEDLTGKKITKSENKYFRKFVYTAPSGGTIYYKEFGDPRSMDPKTGQYKQMGVEEEATEIIHLSIYDPDTLYGSPRYINNIPAILGSRECELVNFQFFKENAIPAMAVMISGGYLTENSAEELQRFFMSVKGRESMSRIIVMEAAGDTAAASDDGKIPPPTMKMEMLGQGRQDDAQFQAYDDDNRKKVQSSFRIPDILLGRSTDYSRNTSDSAKAMAESQVFMPERARIEGLFNTKILPAVVYGDSFSRLKYWKFRCNPSRMASQDGLVDAFVALNDIGAITSNVAIQLANEILGLKIPMSDMPWSNIPFGIVQSLANANNLNGLDGIARDTSMSSNAPVQEKPKASKSRRKK